MNSRIHRNDQGQYAKKHSLAFVIGSWVLTVISLALMWVSSRAVGSDLGALRHCPTDGNNLYIHNCGKTTLNSGDVALIGLFALSACLSFSLLTGLWRMHNVSRRTRLGKGSMA